MSLAFIFTVSRELKSFDDYNNLAEIFPFLSSLVDQKVHLVKNQKTNCIKFFDVAVFQGWTLDKKSMGALTRGKEDGPWVVWHDNGQKESEGNYVKGRLVM